MLQKANIKTFTYSSVLNIRLFHSFCLDPRGLFGPFFYYIRIEIYGNTIKTPSIEALETYVAGQGRGPLSIAKATVVHYFALFSGIFLTEQV